MHKDSGIFGGLDDKMKTVTEEIKCDVCNEEISEENKKDLCIDCLEKAEGLKKYKFNQRVAIQIAFAIFYGTIGFFIGLFVMSVLYDGLA